MSAVQSKVQICNLAISGLGNRNTIMNIDTPKTDKEIVMSLWYDVCRQYTLKKIMPNFALNRVVVSELTVPDAYKPAYAYAYEYPVRALRILGMNDIDTTDNPPTIEAGMILTNIEFTDGLVLRIVDDVEDVSKFSVEFVIQLAKEIEKRTAASITQDPGKKAAAIKEAMVEEQNTSALNSQENKPIRRSVSRFKQARNFYPSDNPTKR